MEKYSWLIALLGVFISSCAQLLMKASAVKKSRVAYWKNFWIFGLWRHIPWWCCLRLSVCCAYGICNWNMCQWLRRRAFCGFHCCRSWYCVKSRHDIMSLVASLSFRVWFCLQLVLFSVVYLWFSACIFADDCQFHIRALLVIPIGHRLWLV